MAKKGDEVMEEQGFHNSHKLYDECLINVVRKGDGAKASTTSVEVRKVLRKGVKIDEGTKDALNRSQDHRNITSDGSPVIKWYFTAGVAKIGLVFSANDVYKIDADGDIVRTPDGSKVIMGLNINETKVSE